MKCPTCVAEGTVSRFWQVGDGVVTLGSTEHYWDEAGNFHNHTTKSVVTNYMCSLGHFTQHKGITPCPTCGKQVDPPEIVLPALPPIDWPDKDAIRDAAPLFKKSSP